MLLGALAWGRAPQNQKPLPQPLPAPVTAQFRGTAPCFTPLLCLGAPVYMFAQQHELLKMGMMVSAALQRAIALRFWGLKASWMRCNQKAVLQGCACGLLLGYCLKSRSWSTMSEAQGRKVLYYRRTGLLPCIADLCVSRSLLFIVSLLFTCLGFAPSVTQPGG